MKYLVPFILLSSVAHAVSFEHPAEEKMAELMKSSVEVMKKNSFTPPSGETPVLALAGDLNFDEKSDMVLVSKKPLEKGKDASEQEFVFSVFFQDGKDWKKVYSNPDLIEPNDDSETGFSGVPEITDEKVLLYTVESSGTGASSTDIYKFRWNKKDKFELIGFVSTGEACTAGPEPECEDSPKQDLNFRSMKMEYGSQKCAINKSFKIPSLTDDFMGTTFPTCPAPVKKKK